MGGPGDARIKWRTDDEDDYEDENDWRQGIVRHP